MNDGDVGGEEWGEQVDFGLQYSGTSMLKSSAHIRARVFTIVSPLAISGCSQTSLIAPQKNRCGLPGSSKWMQFLRSSQVATPHFLGLPAMPIGPNKKIHQTHSGPPGEIETLAQNLHKLRHCLARARPGQLGHTFNSSSWVTVTVMVRLWRPATRSRAGGAGEPGNQARIAPRDSDSETGMHQARACQSR